jgi:hypothetical protein
MAASSVNVRARTTREPEGESTVNAETTEVMQAALQAALTRLNKGSADSQAGPTDTVGALMSMLPALLHNDGSGEKMLEKLDALEKGDLTSIRGQVRVLRKQCLRMLKFQERLLAKVDAMQRHQTVVGRAVMDLTKQMASITFIDDVPTDDDDYEGEAPPAPGGNRRAQSPTNRDGRGTSQRAT